MSSPNGTMCHLKSLLRKGFLEAPPAYQSVRSRKFLLSAKTARLFRAARADGNQVRLRLAEPEVLLSPGECRELIDELEDALARAGGK